MFRSNNNKLFLYISVHTHNICFIMQILQHNNTESKKEKILIVIHSLDYFATVIYLHIKKKSFYFFPLYDCHMLTIFYWRYFLKTIVFLSKIVLSVMVVDFLHLNKQVYHKFISMFISMIQWITDPWLIIISVFFFY